MTPARKERGAKSDAPPIRLRRGSVTGWLLFRTTNLADILRRPQFQRLQSHKLKSVTRTKQRQFIYPLESSTTITEGANREVFRLYRQSDLNSVSLTRIVHQGVRPFHGEKLRCKRGEKRVLEEVEKQNREQNLLRLSGAQSLLGVCDLRHLHMLGLLGGSPFIRCSHHIC